MVVVHGGWRWMKEGGGGSWWVAVDEGGWRWMKEGSGG